MRRRDPNPVFGALGTTIFSVMSALAAKHGAVNLGQGFPDEDGPLAIREAAAKALRQEVRGWRLQLKSDKSIADLSRMFGPVIAGWVNYYCRFHPSAFGRVARHINRALARWAMRKFKTLRGHQRRAAHWVARISRQRPSLFAHWRASLAVAAR